MWEWCYIVIEVHSKINLFNLLTLTQIDACKSINVLCSLNPGSSPLHLIFTRYKNILYTLPPRLTDTTLSHPYIKKLDYNYQPKQIYGLTYYVIEILPFLNIHLGKKKLKLLFITLDMVALKINEIPDTIIARTSRTIMWHFKLAEL